MKTLRFVLISIGGKLNKVVNIRKNKNSSRGISSVFKREIRIENKDLIAYETTIYFKYVSHNKYPLKDIN